MAGLFVYGTWQHLPTKSGSQKSGGRYVTEDSDFGNFLWVTRCKDREESFGGCVLNHYPSVYLPCHEVTNKRISTKPG